MARNLIMLSVPGLRSADLRRMPALAERTRRGEQAELTPSFPCVTWPVQANMLTGQLPAKHGVMANGFYWRDERKVEMWTAWNDRIQSPQIWDLLHESSSANTSAVWFPMLSKGCGADYICMPAPVHNPDGSESLWCYTKPSELYGELRDAMGHFPLQHFWGPLANIKSTAWIAESAVIAAKKFRPRFFFLYLPHLDYAAQKNGPDSPAAQQAVVDLDNVLGQLFQRIDEAYRGEELTWLVAGEYAITPVDHVTYPNRDLRRSGLLQVRRETDGEHLDLERSDAWALVDHQFSHVFVQDRNAKTIDRVVHLFEKEQGIAEVLAGERRRRYSLDHERCGDVVLVSTPNSWQAYYWWLEDANAPGFARTVDIHRKPGYDPVELHFDMTTRSIPLDATLIKGSHGAPVTSPAQRTMLLSSEPILEGRAQLRDVDICPLVTRHFQP